MGIVVTESRPILAWHFLPEDRLTRYEPRVPVTAGLALTVEPPVLLCRHGLHASRRAFDALNFAPGPVACRVALWGAVAEASNKLCASARKVLWMADASQTLRLFALDLGDEVVASERRHGCAWADDLAVCLAVARRHTTGEATSADVREARMFGHTCRCRYDPNAFAAFSLGQRVVGGLCDLLVAPHTAAYCAVVLAAEEAYLRGTAYGHMQPDPRDRPRYALNTRLEERLTALAPAA